MVEKKSLKIAVNTRLLLKNRLEGIGWFMYESLKRIVLNHPEHRFYFLFDRNYDESFVFSDNVIPKVVYPQARHPFLYYLWFEQSVPRLLDKIRPDVFVSPDAFNSLKSRHKSLIVVHDLNFEHHPEILPWLERKYYLHYTPLFVRKADRIATVSEYSKQDIVNQYGINPARIDVTYNGANERFRPLSEEEKIRTRKKYTDGDRYFIFVGAFNKRKNLGNLILAFDKFKKETGSKMKLVLVGEKMFRSDNIEKIFQRSQFKKDIVFTGRLEPGELYMVMGAADALTYVSLFEGFGIPIVEAFFAEIPVITSDVTSMPEIAGDAALLVDPLNPADIASAMKRLENDGALRNELVAKGKIRRNLFSWDKTAEKLWRSIEKTIYE